MDVQQAIDLSGCFRGESLFGDNMSSAELAEWYQDEEDAYFKLWACDRSSYRYEYHQLNAYHAFGKLPQRPFRSLMAFGGGYGDELRPVLDNATHAVIVDPGAYTLADQKNSKIEFRKPHSSGVIPANDGEFDLLTCFSALHHIANVSTVVSEFYRVLAPNGIALLREPTITMGDWRYPRAGLTKRERGIPLRVFDAMIVKTGFSILSRVRCVSPIATRLARALKIRYPFNSRAIVHLDAVASKLTAWHSMYHPTRWWQKIQPSCVCYVLQK